VRVGLPSPSLRGVRERLAGEGQAESQKESSRASSRSFHLWYRFALSILFVVSLAATQYFRQDIRFESIYQTTAFEPEVTYLPPVAVLRTMSIGHPNFVADLLHIRAYQYFVHHLFLDRRYPHLNAFIDAILQLDPRVRPLYRWGAMAQKLGGEIRREDVKAAIALAERGLDWYPNDWQLYLDIGFNYYYEWKPQTDEEKSHIRELARSYFAMAASIPNSGLDPSFVTQLYLGADEAELALFHAYSLYLDASEEERAELRKRIREIESLEQVERLERLDVAWKRDFPFMQRSFFELVGQRELPTLPRSWDELDAIFEPEGRAEHHAKPTEESP
jgi:hypothetical protein